MQNPPIQAVVPDPYELGKKQFARGLYGLALKSFRVALVQQPQSLDRLNAVAATYDKLGRYDLSERYYARALGVDPKSAQTLNNIGYSFLMQKDLVSARYYLEQAAKVARTEDEYIDIVGANLVALDMAEGRTTAVATLQQPIEASAVTTSVDDAKNGAQGEVHAIATAEDVAKVAAAGTMPEQAGGKDGAGIKQGEIVLVPAALPAPEVKAAPVGKVEREVLASNAEPAVKPTPPVSKPVATAPQLLIEVSNGAGRRHLAARTRQYLNDQGIQVGRLTNAENFSFATSTIFYRKGYGEKAREIAALFPVPMELKAIDNQRAHIRVRLGADSLAFDSQRIAEFKGY
jgi:Tfp pilus assembly protein PilF